MKIAITGATGLVGSRIVELLSDHFEFIPLSRQAFDITDKGKTEGALKNLDYDLLLHFAGYTNVDQAEQEKELAYQINVTGTKNLVETVSAQNKKFIYISTDFVFDGTHPPYFEDSTPNPLGYYGKTKYEGEQTVADKGMIVRISFPYRAQFDQRSDFMRKLKSLLEQGKELTMVTDSLITPTFIDDIALALKHLYNNYSPEIFHIVGAQSLSPYEAAIQIAKTFNLDTSLIKQVSFAQFSQGKAPRPQFSQIKSKKNNFYTMKTFADALQILKK